MTTYLLGGKYDWAFELEVDGTMSRGLERKEFKQLSQDPFNLLVYGEDPWVKENKEK